MKGQYRVIDELMIFGIGVGIAVLVLTTFQTINKSVAEVALYDQLEEVANMVSSAVLKVHESGNSAIVLRIPSKLSEMEYKIYVGDPDNDGHAELIARCPKITEINITKELFNIPNNNISGEVMSSAEFIVISNNGVISIKRL